MIINPKEQFIGSTRELINESKDQKIAQVLGLTITTDPEVFDPIIFFSSQWFAEQIAQLIKGEKTIIEVGCGTGIVSLKAAKENPDITVYSTDINPKAAEMTTFNAGQNNLSDQVHAFFGDVFDGLPKDIKAESIFWAMPFGFLNPNEELSGRDWQVFDPGYRAIKKFFAEARNYLSESGRLLIGFSVDIGHLELLEEIAKQNNFSLQLLMKTSGVEKDSVSMEIWEAKFIK